MNDTIQYGFYSSQSNESYIPFQQQEINYNINNDKNNNFCPICYYNYHSHYHRTYCNNGVPVGNGISILLLMLGFYFIHKYFKLNNHGKK